MNDESFYCKRCSKPFDELQMQANEFEHGFGESNTFTARDAQVADKIVQLGCNPAHVFHRECIESFVFCPECFAPIDNDIPESFLDDRSERPEGMDSDEENLLDDANDPNSNDGLPAEPSDEDNRRQNDAARVVSFRLP